MSHPDANANPPPATYAGQHWGVFGLGVTGLSCARHLLARGARLTCVDTRGEPPLLAAVRALSPAIETRCGQLASDVLAACDDVAVSPGVPLDHPALLARARPLQGDIALFRRAAAAPVLGITGSNGKSTVTTLVWEMLARGGRVVQAGGNLGTPALDLLEGDVPDCYVLELSSFQLDLVASLEAEVACVLNLSADHLDRHGSLEAYGAAKARILRGARHVVLNADDPLVAAMAVPGSMVQWFGSDAARARYHLAEHAGARWLCCGEEPVIAAAELGIKGQHNELNALAALAITDCLGLSRAAQCATLREFSGLEHRCREVAVHAGVSWYDDSKGTNIGAASAAIAGIMNGRRGVLIAGGQGKGADFRELRAAVAGRVHTLVLIGEDAPHIANALGDLARVVYAGSMAHAVQLAAGAAAAGDAVLLSPACASFDMFDGYAHRGRVFAAAVRALVAS